MPIPSPTLAPDDLLDDGTALDEVDIGFVMLRPDGYHWQSADGKREFGPFATMEEAIADMQLADSNAESDANEPGETLQEAEDELGIADWIDPDTGGPAEGLSLPRLHDE